MLELLNKVKGMNETLIAITPSTLDDIIIDLTSAIARLEKI